jgi:predicted ATP-grasp superfamily ATP-dependent carboligase
VGVEVVVALDLRVASVNTNPTTPDAGIRAWRVRRV